MMPRSHIPVQTTSFFYIFLFRFRPLRCRVPNESGNDNQYFSYRFPSLSGHHLSLHFLGFLFAFFDHLSRTYIVCIDCFSSLVITVLVKLFREMKKLREQFE